MGSPISTSAKLTASARMNAVIWLRVALDANSPIATSCAVISAAPTYCATMMPGSASETSHTPNAAGSVPASAASANSQLPRNLPSTTSSSVTGCATSHSSVPLRRSSASERIVIAGMKIASSHGSSENIPRSVATPPAYSERNAKNSASARNATTST